MNTIIKEPKGFKQVDTINENGDKVISFEPIKESIVPENWEDFCKICPDCSDDWYLAAFSIEPAHPSHTRAKVNKDLIFTRQRAQAMLAFIQLIRIRDYVNGDWVADWESLSCKYYIYTAQNKINTGKECIFARPLAFKTAEIRDQFLTSFRGLIEEAKEFI